MLSCTSTGGSVVEFSPATREARVRFPASAVFLHYFSFVSHFPISHRNKSIWSIAFPSWLSFLSSWKMLVSRDRKFGWHKFWKKAFFALWSSSHLVPFCSLCKASIVLGWSVWFSLSQVHEWKWLSSSVKPQCDKQGIYDVYKVKHSIN